MGIDVEFAVRTVERLTDDGLAAFEEAFHAVHCDCYDKKDGEHRDPAHRYPRVSRGYSEYPNDIAISSLERYYGGGYTRGWWPRIRAMGDWIALYFGETAAVRYGGDVNDGFDELTDWGTARADAEETWTTVGHRPYRRDGQCDCEHCATLPPTGVTGRSAEP